MIRSVIMPKLGETVEEARIVRWLKREGDWVAKGEPLLVVETDKVSMDVECAASGYLRQRLYSDGQTVAVTLPIAYLADSLEESLQDGCIEPSGFDGQVCGENALRLNKDGEAEAVKQALQVELPRTTVPSPPATPLARRLAREMGIDLRSLTGSGLGGRIIERDILSATHRRVGAMEQESGQPLPLSTMRRRIAERMIASKAVAPHFYLTTRIDMSKALALRDRLRSEGKKVPSYQAMVIAAAARSLKLFPALNSIYTDGGIVVNSRINIGVAVSLEDGLLVPVVRDADRKSSLAITQEVDDLAGRARSDRLSPADCEGGTFTISNLGMYPVDQFVAIINPPQAAILALGRISLEPVAISTEAGNCLGFAHLMHATLSADHRLVDGAVAARFLATLKDALENPEGVLS